MLKRFHAMSWLELVDKLSDAGVVHLAQLSRHPTRYAGIWYAEARIG